MNSWNVIGRVGKDAVSRSGGTSVVAGWSLAVDSGFGDKKQTIWIDCSMWGQRAEKLAPMILKGDRLGVQGELGTREHEGKTYITLKVSEVTLLGDKRGAQSSGNASGKGAPERTTGGTLDNDEIPFAPRGKRNHWEC